MRCGYDVDEKINYFREWTIGADEKTYQAKDTDFVRRGRQQTSPGTACSTEKDA